MVEMMALHQPRPAAGTRSSTPTGHGRLKLVLTVGGLSMFAPLSMDLYLPALPSLTRDLGGSASLVQLTLTACLLGLAVGQLVAGPFSDSLGRRRPLFIGLAVYSVASLLCAFAPSSSHKQGWTAFRPCRVGA